MEKFKMFDIFSKLLTDKNSQNTISEVINNLINKPKNLEHKKEEPKENTQTVKPNKKDNDFSKNAFLLMIKRHDEISKQIDENLKKK